MYLREKLIEALNVPPRVHVRFSCSNAAFGKQALEEPLIVNLQVPRPAAVDSYVRLRKHIGDDPSSGGTGKDGRTIERGNTRGRKIAEAGFVNHFTSSW